VPPNRTQEIGLKSHLVYLEENIYSIVYSIVDSISSQNIYFYGSIIKGSLLLNPRSFQIEVNSAYIKHCKRLPHRIFLCNLEDIHRIPHLVLKKEL